MRISCLLAYITLLNIPSVTASGKKVDKKRAAAKKVGEKGVKETGGKGGKGRKRRVVAQPLITFDQLRNGMENIGKYDRLILEMSPARVLRVRSEWGDLCSDYYSGLENSQVSKSWKIKSALERLDYRVCEEPMEEYSYEGLYEVINMAYNNDEESKVQSLVCTIKPKDEEIKSRVITVGRSCKTSGYDFFRKMKKRITPGTPDAQLRHLECLSMLDQFIRLQNDLADDYERENGMDVSKLKLPEIVGKSVSAVASRDANEENTDESSGLGAGYIVLIIFGVLVALGGGYYGFTKCSSKGKDADDKDRGEKRKRRSDKNRNPQDARTAVQVVGRPVPI